MWHCVFLSSRRPRGVSTELSQPQWQAKAIVWSWIMVCSCTFLEQEIVDIWTSQRTGRSFVFSVSCEIPPRWTHTHSRETWSGLVWEMLVNILLPPNLALYPCSRDIFQCTSQAQYNTWTPDLSFRSTLSSESGMVVLKENAIFIANDGVISQALGIGVRSQHCTIQESENDLVGLCRYVPSWPRTTLKEPTEQTLEATCLCFWTLPLPGKRKEDAGRQKTIWSLPILILALSLSPC